MSEQGRLLGASGSRGCKFGCIYCFTLQTGYQRCPRLDLLRTRDLIDASRPSKIVQPACDTELFLNQNWRDYLDELVSTRKTISFATKASISQEDIGILQEINRLQIKNGQVLHVGLRLSEFATGRKRESVGTVYIVDSTSRDFLLLFHKKLGAWLAPGGHVEKGETPAQAAIREAKEELGVDIQLLALSGGLDCDGKDYRRVESTEVPTAFCTIEEFIDPLGELEPHIHVDSVYIGVISPGSEHVKKDLEEVGARDWFDLERIENLDTFDNVRPICKAIQKALGPDHVSQ